MHLVHGYFTIVKIIEILKIQSDYSVSLKPFELYKNRCSSVELAVTIETNILLKYLFDPK